SGASSRAQRAAGGIKGRRTESSSLAIRDRHPATSASDDVISLGDAARQEQALQGLGPSPADALPAKEPGHRQPAGEAGRPPQAALDGGGSLLPPEPQGQRLHLPVIVNQVVLQIDPRDGPQVDPL